MEEQLCLDGGESTPSSTCRKRLTRDLEILLPGVLACARKGLPNALLADLMTAGIENASVNAPPVRLFFCEEFGADSSYSCW